MSGDRLLIPYGCKEIQMDGRKDKRMDEADGLSDGRTDGWTDGHIERHVPGVYTEVKQ